MSVVHLASHSASEPDSTFFELLASMSKRLTCVPADGVAAAISEALTDIATAIRAENCRLIEFTKVPATARVFTAGAQAPRGSGPAPDLEDWLVERLERGELIAASRPEELPRAAITSREQSRIAAPYSLLGVPASIGGQMVCALVIDSGRVPRRWPEVLITRMQLFADLFAAALVRRRQETTLRAEVSVIEQLNARLEANNDYLNEEIKSQHDFDDIVGESASLRLALSRLSQVAATSSNVLLLGPTGTGKELFARALHERSRRQARPLVRVNCAALPPSLVESELFGHEKGAFTGAVAMRQGRFELADGGTIFLDEIGDLPADIQVKFLRVLQEGEFERLGSS
jgi:transcriptional regulator with GAF, ATPase, and Fis domain